MQRLPARISALLAVMSRLALFLNLIAAPALAEPSDIAAAARSVVRVVLVEDNGRRVTLKGHGSGFAVAPDLIVTNAHVVAATTQDNDLRIGIVPPQGKGGWFARVVALSPNNDLALLKLTEKGSLPVASLFTGAVTDGADVYAVGYPGNVDLAQGLGIADIVSPTPPVKTRGNVSAGRSSKQFDTILHTAAIGSGNSGGPLLDACGRVIGANSFGTVSDTSDSEFYFAVSMREIIRFLTAFQVRPQVTGVPCRSIAELDASEAERVANEKAVSLEQQRIDQERRDLAMRSAERKAQLQVISERENGMALAGLALLFALASGTAAVLFAHKDGMEARAKWARIGVVVLAIAGVVAWFSRPSLEEIDTRTRELMNSKTAKAGQPVKPSGQAKDQAGRLICVLEPDRSRVTISAMTDVPLSWTAQGCVNGRTQYGLGQGGWSRVLLPNQEDTATVASFDPETMTYRTERFLLDLETMDRLRSARAAMDPPSCGADETTIRQLGDAQANLRAMLPETPNERLVYKCQAAANAVE